MKTEQTSDQHRGEDAPAPPAAEAARSIGQWCWMAVAVLLPLGFAALLLTRSPVRAMAEMPPPVGDLQLDYDRLNAFSPLWPDADFPVDARINRENRTLQILPRFAEGRIELPSPYISWEFEDGSELALGHLTFARAEDVPLPPDFGLPDWSGAFLLRTPLQDEPLARAPIPGTFGSKEGN